MDRKFSELIAKLIMLGNRVKVVDDTSLIATDTNSKKLKIMIRENDKTTISEEFDAVESLTGSPYYLVRIRKKYGIVYKADKIDKYSMYTQLGRCALASNGKYNAIAKFSNGLYGVIDVDDRVVIPFCHSQIELYKMKDSWVYVGNSLDCKKVYKDNGELYDISNVVDTRDIIICQEYVIVYEQKHSQDCEYVVYDLDGNILLSNNIADLVSKDEYYQLVDNKGNILMDNIQRAKKILGEG